MKRDHSANTSDSSSLHAKIRGHFNFPRYRQQICLENRTVMARYYGVDSSKYSTITYSRSTANSIQWKNFRFFDVSQVRLQEGDGSVALDVGILAQS